MPMKAALRATPHYVLMDGKLPIGPSMLPPESNLECSRIYGFSDKEPYDAFCADSEMALTPYPLVKGYLRNELSGPDGLKLVVVDAAGPRDPYLHAATMEAVLEAHEKGMAHVIAAYQLVFDEQAEAYRVEDVSASIKLWEEPDGA